MPVVLAVARVTHGGRTGLRNSGGFVAGVAGQGPVRAGQGVAGLLRSQRDQPLGL